MSTLCRGTATTATVSAIDEFDVVFFKPGPIGACRNAFDVVSGRSTESPALNTTYKDPVFSLIQIETASSFSALFDSCTERGCGRALDDRFTLGCAREGPVGRDRVA